MKTYDFIKDTKAMLANEMAAKKTKTNATKRKARAAKKKTSV